MRIARSLPAVPFALLAAALPAQARAPFTGCVLDAERKAIAGAQVTCVFAPGSMSPGAPDRVQGATDGEGRFALQLVVGNPYLVWALGPADAQGRCAVLEPDCIGAGGKVLDLIAGEQRSAVLLRVRGTAPWQQHGPLTLRLLLSGSCAVADLPLPGDGPLRLPVLPEAAITVQLLDGRGRLVHGSALDLDAQPAIDLPPPQAVPVLATDEMGRPLAGVAVLYGEQVFAVTGEDGKATLHLAEGGGWLRAHLAGRGDAASGWMRGMRFHNGQQVADEGPLKFELAPAEPIAVRVLGLAPGERVEVAARSSFRFRYRNGAGAWSAEYPATAIGDDFRFDGASPVDGTAAVVQVFDQDATPHRVVAGAQGLGLRLPDIDLAALRRMPIQVVDEQGRAAACAQLRVADAGPGHPVSWYAHLVTDAGGRAVLRFDRRADYIVYAWTEAAHAAVVVAKEQPSAGLRLVLQPIATGRIRIVDATAEPVAGARLLDRGGSFRSSASRTAAGALAKASVAMLQERLRRLRSGGDGWIELPLPEGGDTVRCQAQAGARKSDLFTPKPGTAMEPIVVR